MDKLIGNLQEELERAKEFLRSHKLDDWVEAIEHHQNLLESGDLSKFPHLWDVFAPTCDWDDLGSSITGNTNEFINTGESVFKAVDALVKQQGIDIKAWRVRNA